MRVRAYTEEASGVSALRGGGASPGLRCVTNLGCSASYARGSSLADAQARTGRQVGISKKQGLCKTVIVLRGLSVSLVLSFHPLTSPASFLSYHLKWPHKSPFPFPFRQN